MELNLKVVLALFSISIILGWGAWQIIFKPLMNEYDSKMGISSEGEENIVGQELSELEAEIELDIEIERKSKTTKPKEDTVA